LSETGDNAYAASYLQNFRKIKENIKYYLLSSVDESGNDNHSLKYHTYWDAWLNKLIP